MILINRLSPPEHCSVSATCVCGLHHANTSQPSTAIMSRHKHSAAFIPPPWLTVTCSLWPPTAALTSTLPWLCDTFDCTCQALSSKPYPLNTPTDLCLCFFFSFSSEFPSLFLHYYLLVAPCFFHAHTTWHRSSLENLFLAPLRNICWNKMIAVVTGVYDLTACANWE